MTKTHHLKTDPAVFDAIDSGVKTFDVRRDDRLFQAGDIVELIRLDAPAMPFPGPPVQQPAGTATNAADTRKRLTRRITWILPAGTYGLREGFVAFALAEMVSGADGVGIRWETVGDSSVRPGHGGSAGGVWGRGKATEAKQHAYMSRAERLTNMQTWLSEHHGSKYTIEQLSDIIRPSEKLAHAKKDIDVSTFRDIILKDREGPICPFDNMADESKEGWRHTFRGDPYPMKFSAYVFNVKNALQRYFGIIVMYPDVLEATNAANGNVDTFRHAIIRKCGGPHFRLTPWDDLSENTKANWINCYNGDPQ